MTRSSASQSGRHGQSGAPMTIKRAATMTAWAWRILLGQAPRLQAMARMAFVSSPLSARRSRPPAQTISRSRLSPWDEAVVTGPERSGESRQGESAGRRHRARSEPANPRRARLRRVCSGAGATGSPIPHPSAHLRGHAATRGGQSPQKSLRKPSIRGCPPSAEAEIRKT